MKIRIKRLFCILIVLATVLFTGLRIFYVNAHSYSFDEEICQAGEWIPLGGDFFYSETEGTDHYSVRISLAETVPYQEFMKRFGKEPNYFADGIQFDVILLKVDFKNDGNDQGGVFIRDMNLLNESFSIYYDKFDEYMKIANSELDSSFTGISVRPGTEASMWFVYSTIGRADGVTYLDEIKQSGTEKVTMYLVVSLYPVKKLIQLELDTTPLLYENG